MTEPDRKAAQIATGVRSWCGRVLNIDHGKVIEGGVITQAAFWTDH